MHKLHTTVRGRMLNLALQSNDVKLKWNQDVRLPGHSGEDSALIRIKDEPCCDLSLVKEVM